MKFLDKEPEKLTHVVIVARYQDTFVFCKHKDRTTYELPGGHIEINETAIEAAKRKLKEETGAISFSLKFVCFYEFDVYGAVYYADIKELGSLKYEIEELSFLDYMPAQLTYPAIEPRIFNYVIQHVQIHYGSNHKRMVAGALYSSKLEDPSLHRNAVRMAIKYNQTMPDELEKRKEIIRKAFGSTKEHFYIEPSIRMDYGFNIHIGDYFYANFDCVFLDVAPIIFGDHVYVAPRCCFFTAGHPIDADVRKTDLEYGYPIRVGSDVWFGGGVIVNPGVTIGSNVVIGSGSVVTKDIPSNVIACGNPCRVIRPITNKDKLNWERQQNWFMEEFNK